MAGQISLALDLHCLPPPCLLVKRRTLSIMQNQSMLREVIITGRRELCLSCCCSTLKHLSLWLWDLSAGNHGDWSVCSGPKTVGKEEGRDPKGRGGLPDPCEQTLVQKENCKSICDTLWALSVFPICLGQDWALPPHLNHAMQQGSMCFHGMLVKAMICGMLNPWLGMYNNNENCRLSFTDYLLCWTPRLCSLTKVWLST